MEIKEIDGVKHVRTLIPCPDGIKGCLVAHYRWIPIKEEKEGKFLTDKQKEQIELYYKDFSSIGRHSNLNGIEYMLIVIDEIEFKDYLFDKYLL